MGAAPKDRRKPEPEPAPLFPVEVAWTITLDAPPSAAGVMDDDRVYIPVQGGGVLAIERETGVIAWTAPIESHWPPVVVGGVVVFDVADGLRAVAVGTGAPRWLTAIAAPVAPLSAAAGRVIVATEGGEAVAVSSATGEVIWRQALGGLTHHPAAMGSTGIVVFSLEDSRVVALNTASGHVVWTRSLEGALSAPATARGRVLVGSTNNFFYALDPETGAEVWRWQAGGDVVGAAADGEIVYYASLDNILRAVNRGNGNQLWKAVVPTRPAAPPVAFDGLVVSTGVAPRVDAFDGKTGKAQGTYAAQSDLAGSAMIDTALKPYRVGMVTLTRNGQVTALRPSKLMMRDPSSVPMQMLPGRHLDRDRWSPTPP